MPSSIFLYVNDVDAVHRRAVQAGATSVMEPADMSWGDRFSRVKDAFGNLWGSPRTRKTCRRKRCRSARPAS